MRTRTPHTHVAPRRSTTAVVLLPRRRLLLPLLAFVGRVRSAIPATGPPPAVVVGDRTSSNERKRGDVQGPCCCCCCGCFGSFHGVVVVVPARRRSGGAAFVVATPGAGSIPTSPKAASEGSRIRSRAAAAPPAVLATTYRTLWAVQPTGDESDASNDACHDLAVMMMLRISYDGRAFTGWSAANDPHQRRQKNQQGSEGPPPALPPQPSLQVGGTRKRRRTTRSNTDSDTPPSQVRSVQGEIVKCLARLYGNRQEEGVAVVLDSCSRTDKGVHATHGGMVALAYAYDDRTLSSPPTRLPLPLPMPPSRILYALNRMLPADVRITSIAAVRRTDATPINLSNATGDSNNYDGRAKLLPSSLEMNHSSTGRARPPVQLRHVLTNIRKTYRYQFSTGPYHDPMSRKTRWHVTPLSRNNGAPPTGMSSPSAPAVDSVEDVSGDDGTSDTDGARTDGRIAAHDLDAAAMRRACRMLEGGTRDFRAFQAGPRGSERRDPRTVCTLDSIVLMVTDVGHGGLGKGRCRYQLEVTGDRFLYKMVRMMVGCVVAVGQGRIDPKRVEQTVEEGASRDAWPEFTCAPSHGLALVRVQYETQPGWDVSWL